jgi:solute carrier family 25 carnitine/acylcarnitine transporter 20/29
VGVAYPFDTIKTKAQVYSSNRPRKEDSILLNTTISIQQSTDSTHHEHAPSGTVHLANSTEYVPIESPEDDLISLVRLILEMEGISGFFGGVRAMMIGQALIKSVAFSANELALGVLNGGAGDRLVESGDGDVSFVTLLLAASFSGFVTSFLVAPVGEFLCSYL